MGESFFLLALAYAFCDNFLFISYFILPKGNVISSFFSLFLPLFLPPPNLFFFSQIPLFRIVIRRICFFDLLTFLLFSFLISLARPLSRIDKGRACDACAGMEKYRCCFTISAPAERAGRWINLWAGMG